ncbi:MAG: glycosyltransferase family 39 protein [Candidatus Omnitrophica bacterium]|jgi:hypothetical protein|nr:glycosyltransferase family 39 protein [Candidatus Omnitrophota bacterium]MDD5080188.1 glycosyltransferase family 39 protein [Candidatus Omnitrophota bacterium]
MNDRLKRILPGLLLSCLIAFHVINNLIWLNIDTSFLKLDSWREWDYSLRVFDFLKSLSHFPHFSSLSTIAPPSWHGIFTGFIIAPFYLIFGPGQDAAVLINSTIFLTLLILSVYALAKKISGNDQRVGIFAAFLVSFYPLIFNHTRLFMLDLPLAAIFSAGLYFLIASDRFTDKKNSLAFGICLGLGLLTKFNFILFIAGPLFLSLCLGLREKKDKTRTAAKNIRILALAAFSLSALFYFSRSGDILQRVRGLTCGDIMRAYRIQFPEFIVLKISWLVASLATAISDGMSFILFLSFLLAVYPFYGSKTKNKAELSLTIGIPLFTYIFILILDPGSMLRYSLPILPVAAVITAIGLLRSRSGRIWAGFISAAAILQFFAVSYGIPALPQKTGFCLNRNKPFAFDLVLFKQKLEVNPYRQDKSSHPSRSDWKAGDVFNIIKKDAPSGKHIKILMLSSPPEIYEAISAMIALNKERVSILTINMVEPFYIKRFAPLGELCLITDYLLILDRKTAPKPDRPRTEWERKIAQAQEVFYRNIDKFTLLESVRLPDNTNLLVYKNTAYPGSAGSRTARSGGLKAVFDSGSCRIFYNGVEITRGLGLFSAVLSQQSWRDSLEAVWSVKKEGDSRLIASGRWMFAPVKQIWVIDVFPGKITWRIKLEGENNVKIKAIDCKLMLSDKYKVLTASTGIQKALDFRYADEPCKRVWAGSGSDTMTFTPRPEDKLSLPKITLAADLLPAGSISVAELSVQPSERAITAGFYKKNGLSDSNFQPGKSQDFRIELLFDQN